MEIQGPSYNGLTQSANFILLVLECVNGQELCHYIEQLGPGCSKDD